MLLGVHIAKSSKVLDDKKDAKQMADAIIRDLDPLGLNAAQIFTFGPRFIVPNKIDYGLLKKTCKDIDLTVHSAYPSVAVWKVTAENKKQPKMKKAIDDINKQLQSCKKAEAWGLVLHITKQLPEQIAIVMKMLKPYAKQTGVKILIEMVSNKADIDTYETPEKINYLTELIGVKETWWGWCIDTAHLWGAGVSISKYTECNKWISHLKYKKKIKMIHLNGSSAFMGDGKDKHEIPFSSADNIWNGINPKESGLRAFVEFASANDITIICEINRGRENMIKKSLELIKELGGV